MTRNQLRRLITEHFANFQSHGVTGDHMIAGTPVTDGFGGHELDPAALRPAAVLFGLMERRDGLSVILTRRTAHLSAHAGQVSFPGGRCEDCDRDAVATALRETEEEIGLAPEHVEVVGELDEYRTGTGFSITPIVGFVRDGVALTPDPNEVDEIFEVPFDFLMDPRNHRRERVHWRGAMREYYAMPYQGHNIWGATAGIIRNFYERIRGV